MTKTIDDLFVFLRFSTDLLMIVVLVYLMRKKNNAVRGALSIILFLIYDLLVYVMGEHLQLNHPGIIIFYSSFTFIEYLLFAWFIYQFIKSRTFRRFMVISSILFVVSLVAYTAVTPFKSIDSIPIGVETIMILIFSFYYLYEQMNDLANDFVYNQFSFWVITGFMVYLAGCFFIYVFAAQIDRKIILQYWFLTNAFYTLKNVLLGVGLLVTARKSKQPRATDLYPYLN